MKTDKIGAGSQSLIHSHEPLCQSPVSSLYHYFVRTSLTAFSANWSIVQVDILLI